MIEKYADLVMDIEYPLSNYNEDFVHEKKQLVDSRIVPVMLALKTNSVNKEFKNEKIRKLT